MVKDSAKLVLINGLTISRIAFSFLVLFGLSDWSLFVISILASLSDFLDGFLARNFNLVTTIGQRLDQIADKTFHFVILSYLTYNGLVSPYFTALFFLREILMLIFRYLNISIQASRFPGKLKTFLTYSFVIFLFGNQFFALRYSFHIIVILAFEVTIIFFSYYSFLYSR